jgi:hypothetical protein
VPWLHLRDGGEGAPEDEGDGHGRDGGVGIDYPTHCTVINLSID